MAPPEDDKNTPAPANQPNAPVPDAPAQPTPAPTAPPVEPAPVPNTDAAAETEKSDQPAPKVQQFNLKPNESQTLLVINANHQSAFASVLSMIAVERLGYHVTERTQFQLDEKLTTMSISELPQDVPVAKAPEQPDAPKTGAVPAQ